ncbi:MAG TPA: FKBP-type peptidyl-prolyl cis-trans isomerase [Fimbriimonadaceae bacterium]|nr:FKBP-type peptidyl-prolyl cis-trans isomerase [Fimbriimonadaceae bacterium]
MNLRSALLLLPLAALAIGCAGEEAAKKDEHEGHAHAKPPAPSADAPKVTKLEIKDVKVGTGQAAEEGDLLLMQYTGTRLDGKQFDTNDPEKKEGATPFSFVLGEGSVIKGWDQGLKGMKVGGERELLIPPDLAYGDQGAGEDIPPNTPLKFEVKLLDVVKKGEEGVYDKTELKAGTGPVVKQGSKVSLHYTGSLVNGKKFDSSLDRKQPLEIEVGKTELIPAFTAALPGMRQGGKYRLRIPPAVGYGVYGRMPEIPGNSVLIFEIEIMKVQ